MTEEPVRVRTESPLGADTPGAARRYETYWTHTSEALFTVRVRPDGEFEFEGINPAAEKRTGVPTSEVAGKTPHECLPPEVADAVVARYRACVAAGRATRYLETLDLPGGVRHWETSLAPVRDADGRIALLLGSARDITEQDHLQLALSDSEARFRLLAETVPDMVFTVTAKGRVEFLSSQFFAYTGANPEARVNVLSYVHPADRKAGSRWRDQSARHARFTTELRVLGRDGTYRWFLMRAARVSSTDGPTWFGVATDIHEVKQAIEVQHGLNDRLNSILSSISDCYYTIDRDWKVTSLNAKTAAWLGRPAEQVVGLDLRADHPLHPTIEATISGVMTGGEWAHCVCESISRPGRFVDLHAYPNAEGVSIFFRDVTEEHVARRELLRAQDLLQLTVDSLSAHVAILDSRGVVTAANKAWRDYGGTHVLPLHCKVGVNCLETCGSSAEEERSQAAVVLRDVLEGRSDGFTHLHRSDDDPARWFHVVARRFEHEGEPRVVVAFEDVTELTLAQQSLMEEAERHIVTQEEERRRIAGELHDSTGQHLVALSLTANRLKDMIPDGEEASSLFADLRTALANAQREIRVYSYLLHPPYLEHEGLTASLRKFLRGFARRSGLQIVDRIDDGADRAGMSARRAVFRIVQEALSNVQRHAGATKVIVHLKASDRLSLRIEDDGVGMPASEADGPAVGVGMSGMHARVRELGGEIRFDQAGGGLIIQAEIPFQAAVAASAD